MFLNWIYCCKKICERVFFEYELDVAYGDNDNVTLTMPKENLLLTYYNDKMEEHIVECVCSENISFKYNSTENVN